MIQKRFVVPDSCFSQMRTRIYQLKLAFISWNLHLSAENLHLAAANSHLTGKNSHLAADCSPLEHFHVAQKNIYESHLRRWEIEQPYQTVITGFIYIYMTLCQLEGQHDICHAVLSFFYDFKKYIMVMHRAVKRGFEGGMCGHTQIYIYIKTAWLVGLIGRE